MALEKGTEEWQMFGDYFNLCKKFWNVSTDDEYWDMLIYATNEFYEKYKDIPLSKQLVLGFVNAQEKRLKQRIGKIE